MPAAERQLRRILLGGSCPISPSGAPIARGFLCDRIRRQLVAIHRGIMPVPVIYDVKSSPRNVPRCFLASSCMRACPVPQGLSSADISQPELNG